MSIKASIYHLTHYKYDKPVISLDFIPTLLEVAGTTTTAAIEGKSLLPYLSGKNPGTPHEKLFWSFVDFPNQKAARVGDWKLVQPRDKAPWELYNLADDIGETRDVAAQHPEIVKSIRKDWNTWNRDNKEPLWMDVRILNRRNQANSETSGTEQAKPRPRKKKANR